jgi:hypothetical protein
MTMWMDFDFQDIEKVYYLRYNLCRIHRDVGSGLLIYKIQETEKSTESMTKRFTNHPDRHF